MTKENYNQLTHKEKLMYDEFNEFTNKLALRIEAMTKVMQRLLEVATHDP